MNFKKIKNGMEIAYKYDSSNITAEQIPSISWHYSGLNNQTYTESGFLAAVKKRLENPSQPTGYSELTD